MKTTLYLIRHGATANNLADPPKLQGRKSNPPLDAIGIHQSQVTAEFLAVRPIEVCYVSPLERAQQTARIICEPHKLIPIVHDGLIEIDHGDWDGMDWPTIKAQDPYLYEQAHTNPAITGYKGGENFAQVLDRVKVVMDEIARRHAGKAIMVVAHHIVNRVFMAEVLGLGANKARKFSLDNCSISVVTHENGKFTPIVLNSNFHLQGISTSGTA